MENKSILDVSWAGIFKVVFVLLIAYILFLIKDILILIIFSLVISVLFNPLIDFFQRLKVPRVVSAGLIYFFSFVGLALIVYFMSLSFIPEVQLFAESFSDYFTKIAPPLKGMGIEAFESFDIFIETFEDWLKGASSNIFAALSSFFGGAFSAVFVVFLAFFFSLEEKGMEKTIKLFFPKKQEELALNVWKRSQKKISGWFGARIACSIFVAIASFIALKIFKIDYALSFSLFAGITNIIPYLGPMVAGALITILVFIEDWTKAIFIMFAFIIIQQLEGNIISPILTKRFIGLPPSLVLISLIIGGQLWGLLGMILVIPLAGILFEFIRDYLKKKKERDGLVQEEASARSIVT